MKFLLILGCVFLVLGLLLLIRVGGEAEYSSGGLSVRLRLGVFRYAVWPVKAKKKKKEQKKAQKKEAAPPPPGEEKPRTGGNLPMLREILTLIADMAGRLKRKIRIDSVRMDVTVAAADPAEAALAFGGVNAAIGMIWPLVEHNFNVKDRRIRTRVDFDGREPSVYALAAFSLTVGQAIALGIRVLARFLKTNSGNPKSKQKEAV